MWHFGQCHVPKMSSVCVGGGGMCVYCILYACVLYACVLYVCGARYSSMVRAFAHGAVGRQIDPSCGGPIELFLIPASAPRLV